jgi:hypothetical protein
MRVIHDATGRVTLAVPNGWLIRSTAEPGRTPVLIVRSPGAGRGEPASVIVVEEDLPAPITPAAFAEGVRRKISRRDLVIIREGPTRIGGIPAFSRTSTWKVSTGATVYGLETYLTSGTLAVMAMGLTANVPARLRDDLPVLRRILDTIRIDTTRIASAAQRYPSPEHQALVPVARRDLFAAPPEALNLRGDQALPPQVTGGAAPGLPHPPAPVKSLPPVALAGLVLGGEPQATLRSGTTYLVVQRGDPTPWGTVRSITSAGVAVDSGGATKMITFTERNAP